MSQQDAFRAAAVRGVGYTLQTIDWDNGSADVIKASIATLTNVLAAMNRQPDEASQAAVEHVRSNIDAFVPKQSPKPNGKDDDKGTKVKAAKPKPKLPPQGGTAVKPNLADLQQQLAALQR